MPLYDYKCTEHGLFHELVPVQASGEACPCPTCGVLSARVILVAPEVPVSYTHLTLPTILLV